MISTQAYKNYAEQTATEVVTELMRAKTLFPAFFVNQHEAYAVILEEIDELWVEIKKNQKNYDLQAQRKEAIQAAAMLVRLVVELLSKQEMTNIPEVNNPAQRRLYIAGKIGGLPFDQVQKKFQEAKTFLKSIGYDAVIPIEFAHNHGKTWSEYMLEDLSELNRCDGICMLDCWEDSPGAKIEHAFAVRSGKKVLMYSDLEHF